MSRNEEFSTGVSDLAAQLRTNNPNLSFPQGEQGEGPSGSSRDLVGFVPTHLLAGMPGNRLDRSRVSEQRESLSKHGFREHILVNYDKSTGNITVGDGNHRLQAAVELGITHVPVKVHRLSIDSGAVTRHVGKLPRQEQGEYVPPDMHPSWIWGRQVL